MKRLRHFFLLAWAIAASGVFVVSTDAQTNSAPLLVRGAVAEPLSLTLADLAAMPRTKLTAREKDGTEVTFEGVALNEIISRAKPQLTDKCCSNTINTVIVIRAADNYQATFSLPELDPKFSQRRVLLADHRDGQLLKPPQGPLQIVVPEETVHARWVKQVNLIEVLPLGEQRGTNSLPP